MQGRRALFLFHADLRLFDNTALIAAARDGFQILPVFILPPEQIDPAVNKYFSPPFVQFMMESLADLDAALRKLGTQLYLFYGDNIVVLDKIFAAVKPTALYTNESYTVYGRSRDARIAEWCRKKAISFVTHEDTGLLGIREGLLDGERPYKVLAQYYKNFLKNWEVRAVDAFQFKKAHFTGPTPALKSDKAAPMSTQAPDLMRGGRAAGLKRLQNIAKNADYAATRDFPANTAGTTHLSPYLRLGCISIRELYHAAVAAFKTRDHPLIRELCFRDWYLKIYTYQPELQRGVAYHAAMDARIPWRYDKKAFAAWCEGRTGFPLVDAGMRELNATGHMHNRVRMVVACFLTRYLLIDWRWGLQYFYTHLVDADPISNTAGWQFSSGIGVDAAPYFRAPMNPFLQSKKFDPDATYIKKWIPELANISPRDIHKWYDAPGALGADYPMPMIDYKTASRESVAIFKHAARGG